MPLPVLTIEPLQSGYSFTDGTVTQGTALKGGLGRRRRDLLTASVQVSVSWSLNQARYNALRAFYEETVRRGGLAFEIDLIIDDAELTRHQAHFQPGSFALGGVSGGRYSVSATLSVRPRGVSDYLDNIIMDEFEGIDREDPNSLFNLLEALVNIDLPDALE